MVSDCWLSCDRTISCHCSFTHTQNYTLTDSHCTLPIYTHSLTHHTYSLTAPLTHHCTHSLTRHITHLHYITHHSLTQFTHWAGIHSHSPTHPRSTSIYCKLFQSSISSSSSTLDRSILARVIHSLISHCLSNCDLPAAQLYVFFQSATKNIR